MARVRLTAKGVENLSTDRPQEDFWDSHTTGLCLRVSGRTGRKTWLVRYRRNGIHRRMKIGVYPRLDLASARSKAEDVLVEADAGGDPYVEHAERAREEEEREAKATTFGTMADEVLKALARKGSRGKPTSEVTQRERRRIVDAELVEAWGDHEAASITRRDVVLLVEAIEKRGAPVLANRTLALIRLLFNVALRRAIGGIESNPAQMVEAPGVETGRDRYLKTEEIRAVWKATEDENPLTRGAFRLTLLTGQRIGSVLAMRWDGIEEDVWTIPEEHFKGRRVHLVPLSKSAIEIIDDLRVDALDKEWVFPSRAKAKTPHLTNLGKALSRIRERSSVPDWTLHDFRTTFRTHAVRSPKDGGLGIPAHVADAVLGHKEASLGFDRYTGDQHTYQLQEKREALRAWGQFVVGAVEGGL